MKPESLPETLGTFGHDVELIEVTLEMFPPEAFPDRVRKGRPERARVDDPQSTQTYFDGITYFIGDTDDPDTPTPPG